ncbi:MAG: ABC transporter ATP-binding protein [Labilithrix sp.]
MSIAVAGVSQRFGDVTALDDVTFTLTGPKLVVILGPNGAGKTTLLDLIEGLAEPTAGRVSLFGDPVRPEAYPRRKIGVVMQKEFVLDGVTVGDYAELFASIYEVDGGRARILERAELAGRAPVSVDRLSGGEAQRLFIAAASVHDPEILFLDEPTSELDPENKRRIGEVLRRQAERALVVMTTHDLTEADLLADEVMFLLDGKLRAHGPKSEVVGAHDSLSAAFFHYCGRTLSRSGEAT